MTGLADKQQAHPGGLLKDFSGDARDIFGEGAPLRHPHPRFLFSTGNTPLRNRTAPNLVRICGNQWGYSSVGRALQSHCRGQRFDSA